MALFRRTAFGIEADYRRIVNIRTGRLFWLNSAFHGLLHGARPLLLWPIM